jgi:hypothetical protein
MMLLHNTECVQYVTFSWERITSWLHNLTMWKEIDSRPSYIIRLELNDYITYFYDEKRNLFQPMLCKKMVPRTAIIEVI